jgi:hypothetical protein
MLNLSITKNYFFHPLGVLMGQVGPDSGRVILFYYYFCSDPNPTRLNPGQKILTHTRPDRITGRPDPTCVK